MPGEDAALAGRILANHAVDPRVLPQFIRGRRRCRLRRIRDRFDASPSLCLPGLAGLGMMATGFFVAVHVSRFVERLNTLDDRALVPAFLSFGDDQIVTVQQIGIGIPRIEWGQQLRGHLAHAGLAAQLSAQMHGLESLDTGLIILLRRGVPFEPHVPTSIDLVPVAFDGARIPEPLDRGLRGLPE